jgi:integrase
LNSDLPRYASRFSDRHGKARIRFRRTGWQSRYAEHLPGSAEFTQEYHNWLENAQNVREKVVKEKSFDDLIARFYRSSNWTRIKPTTQGTYRGELERFRSKYGTRSCATMDAQNVDRLMADMAKTPSAANNLKKRLSQLFDFAILLGWRKDNPAKAVRSLKTTSKGFKTWQEKHIAAFEARWPVGSMPRLAFDLALYTAQRRSDVRVMGPQHVKDGKISVLQLKTDKRLRLPIHPKLKASMAATASGHLAYIVTARGLPFRTNNSFGMWFMRACREAGLEGYAMHGLRKAASRRMAEMGLSNQLIKSITGHSSDAEVARYTREAAQELMADEAGRIMANRAEGHLSNHDESDVNAG